MIGWRPVLVTVAAAVLLTFVVLDQVVADRKLTTDAVTAKACDDAKALQKSGFYAEATKAYVALMKQDAAVPMKKPTKDAAAPKKVVAACAKAGWLSSGYAACVRADLMRSSDPEQARQLLRALASADPALPPDACVWRALSRLAKTKTKAVAE
jgi:hypothetical protein